LKPVERLIRVEECVLDHILGILGVLDQTVDAMVETLLIAAHQYPKGCRVALQTLSDEALIVGTHGSLPPLDVSGAGGVPKSNLQLCGNGKDCYHLGLRRGQVIVMMPHLHRPVKENVL